VDESVRLNAALDLADAADPAGIPVLIDALGHEWSVVRASFARPALARLGHQAVPDLERAASAEQPLVALGAAVALAQIDPSRTREALAVLRRALAEGGPAAEDALEVLWLDRESARALRDELPAVVGGVGDGGWLTDARVLAALLLAREAPEWASAQAAVADALASDEPAVRRGGAVAFGHAGMASPDVVRRLQVLVLDEDEVIPVRIAAAYALARVGDPAKDSIPPLTTLLGSGVAGVRVAAVRILGEMGAGEPLYEQSDNRYVWLASAHAVATVEPDRVAGLVASALDDADPNVRRNAILALSWFGPAAREAGRRLAEQLAEPYFGPLVAEALARIDGRPVQRSIELDDLYPQVRIEWTEPKRAAFEHLFAQATADGSAIPYDLPYPKHEFLRYLCDTRRLMLHGSARSDLDILKPLRDSTDVSEWGNLSGVYAESDPVRPIYFAVVDRRGSFGLMNGCFAIADDGSMDSRLDDPARPRHYRLSVGFPSVGADIWREGWVYALPGDTFEFWEEWTSRAPVRPVFRIAVSRDDLPLDVSYADVRKPGGPWVELDAEFPYLDDVWAVPVRVVPSESR
jgi:HEAT repeat protein